MCCSKMGLNFNILQISPELFTWRFMQKALRTWQIILPIFLYAKTILTLWRRDNVRKFMVDAILFIEIQCKKRESLMF